MIQLTERGVTGSNLNVTMPHPDKIANGAIRTALEVAIDRHASVRESRRCRDAKQDTLARVRGEVETEAAELLIEGVKLPKGMRKAIKAAEDDYEEAQLEANAATTAYAHAYTGLVAVVDANADAWRAAALKDAARALNLVAAARKSLETADAEALSAFGVLGMLNLNKTRDRSTLVLAGAPQALYTSQALLQLTDAIGVLVSTLEELKRG